MRLNKLFSYFIPRRPDWEDWSYRKHRIFAGVCLVAALYAFLFWPQVLMMDYRGPDVIIPVFGAVNIAFAFLLRRGLSLVALAHLFIVHMAGTLAFILWYSGGVFHTASDPQLFVMLPMMALLFLNFRWAIFYFLLGVAIIVSYGVLQAAGHVFTPQMNPEFVLMQTVSAAAGHLLIIFMVINIFERQKAAALKSLQEKNALVEQEKQRSDDLLRNILPEETMRELKATGQTTARSYKMVTVLFADFKDFTIFSQQLDAETLVQSIDQYFEAFDRIIAGHDVEKIKTVGDAYICASGLPQANDDNACIIVGVGLEMLRAVREIGERRRNLGLHAFEVRIGVHSGPLVAGVVGIKKFAYDIWGDTVNTAARMQQGGEPGKMNISGATYELVKKDYTCVHRGKIEAKHKGAVDMYFVEEALLAEGAVQ